MAVNLFGFDSAWAGHVGKPGAICAMRLADGEPNLFDAPQQAGFDDARHLIVARHSPGDLTIIAIDQPTIVRNISGARPAERAVASLMSFSGGGIQPAYREKAAMFGDAAPIWRFLADLGFTDDPQAASRAAFGGFVLEVFPALAVLALAPAFMAGPKCGPRYNPSRPTFRQTAWAAVCAAVSAECRRLRLPEAATWCDALDIERKPRKREQDSLDAIICLLTATRWLREPETCVMVGDIAKGYIVAPVSPATRARLARAAAICDVPIF